MVTNNFPILIAKIKEAVNAKSLNKAVREKVKPVANSYVEFIIGWLNAKQYPLRRGMLSSVTSNRWDNLYEMTPTERLWDGYTLADGQQKPRFSALRKVIGARIAFNNDAEHAKYFFPEVEAHPIPLAKKTKLRFNWGDDLPWYPLDDKDPGERVFPKVNHPGHMDYGELLAEAFETDFAIKMNKQIGIGTQNTVTNTLRELFK